MKTKNKPPLLRNRKSNKLDEGFAFKYLHKQFPWLSETDILEAIKLKGSNADQVIKYLSEKGSKSNFEEQDD